MPASGVTPILDSAPQADSLTDHDRAHLTVYMRLLDAEATGAAMQGICSVLFGIDADHDPERARKVYDSHLARAHWMTENGYRKRLEGGVG